MFEQAFQTLTGGLSMTASFFLLDVNVLVAWGWADHVDHDPGGREWPDWCASASRTTGAHLLRLAQHHGMALATLDAGIPGAMLLPVTQPAARS